MAKKFNVDPIVPGKIITLKDGRVVASPARKSFLKMRGLSTQIHQATVDCLKEAKISHSSGECEPVRRKDRDSYTYDQSKRNRQRPADYRKDFFRIARNLFVKEEPAFSELELELMSDFR